MATQVGQNRLKLPQANRVLDAVGKGDFHVTSLKQKIQKPRILIVEDGIINRKLLENLLRPVSTFDVASDGEAGLQVFLRALDKQEPFDLIFLDIMMPKMDGQQMLKNLREEEFSRGIWGADGVKVVMTTALKGRANIWGDFRKGCEGYLVKPIQKKALFEKLEELNMLVM